MFQKKPLKYSIGLSIYFKNTEMQRSSFYSFMYQSAQIQIQIFSGGICSYKQIKLLTLFRMGFFGAAHG